MKSLKLLVVLVLLSSDFCFSAPVFQLDPYGSDSIRIRVAPDGGSIVEPPAMALMPQSEVPKVDSTLISRGPNELTVGNLRVVVDPSKPSVTATRVSDGMVLLKSSSIDFAEPKVNGTRTGSKEITVRFEGQQQGLYGFGEHRTGMVNQMPHYQNFSRSQVYKYSTGADSSIPWYASTLGYGFVWNLPSYGYVNATEEAIEWNSVAALNADFWITTTSSATSTATPFNDLLQHYVDAVGHAPPMPFYSTGFIQCKDRYRNQSQVLDVARGYVDRGLPISVIVIDWYHWVNFGDWSFNPTCWPDPQGMFDELQTLGIELMVTFWPLQTTPSQHFNEFNTSGYLSTDLTGKTVPFDGSDYLVDTFNSKARDAMFKAFMEGYGKYGIKTIWLDAAEPQRNSEATLYKARFAAGTDAEVGGAWVQQHTRAFADGMKSVSIEPSEYFVLPRHAWAGSWRYSAGLWSGDIASTFDELTMQITVAQGIMMSGVALWTTDIGGYHGGDPANAEFQELIVRWFQFGAFCPLFRLHGHRAGGPPSNECRNTNGDNEVWNLAKEPAHYDAIATVMHLRENLRSYVTKINLVASKTGMPMLRPMFLNFQTDPNCYSKFAEQQFMFGDEWLVKPVSTYQATEITVYLPALPEGHEWVYFFNETVVPGGGNVTLPTPIDEFGLFYRRHVPIKTSQAAVLFNPERQDHVFCGSSVCFKDNPSSDNYTVVSQDCRVFIEPTVELNGKQYTTVPLNLFFSSKYQDNFVATNSTAPDDSYTIHFQNGFVLAEQVEGLLALNVYLKQTTSITDHVTTANTTLADALVKEGYQFQFTTGYIAPGLA